MAETTFLAAEFGANPSTDNEVSPQLWHACFDAFPLQLCILDETSTICAVNRAWQLACQQGMQYAPNLVLGCNFLAQLAATHTDVISSTNAEQLRQEIRAIQHGERDHAELDITNISSAKVHWFRFRLSKLQVATNTCSGDKLLVCVDEITDRKLEQEAQQAAALVYQYSDQAIMVTDNQARIIAVNPGYTHLTGYQAADVLGKNPSAFSSDRQSKDFYRLMWHTLNTTGSWQGEIWNRKKDGSEFAEWITINAIYTQDADGQPEVERYVALFSDITEQKRASESNWRQANFDPLTALPNRRLMLDRLETELRKAQRHQRLIAVLFIDLDHFKEVNDQLGHAMGDVLLIETARRLLENVRESDTVARLGGDEFIIILGDFHLDNNAATGMPQNGREESAIGNSVEHIAQNILRALRAPFQLGTQTAHVSCSIGIALFPDNGQTTEQLLESADQAMYEAKHAGKNCYCFRSKPSVPAT
ncbi:MAG: diguanylate cyclase, partial [Burkholderiales bacterium]|nr:diguanylate cyclase [Burkholderiales bacterium]